MEKKIELLKRINTDNSRFILNIIDSYNKSKNSFEKQLSNSTVITNYKDEINGSVIDLDKIWSKPYFYTKMRLKLNKIINKIENCKYEDFSKNPKHFCNKLLKIKINKSFTKPDKLIDIVDFINSLKNNAQLESTSFTFIAKNLDEETLFKEEQIKKAIEIIKIKEYKEQITKVYEEINDYLNKDFIANNYCDFMNNKCIAQRHLTLYPINWKNGCCFMEIRKCNHLEPNGSCKVDCLACKLFSCPYLTKKGIGYWASDFILLKAFLNKEQRKHVVFDFYTPKETVIKRLLECKK